MLCSDQRGSHSNMWRNAADGKIGVFVLVIVCCAATAWAAPKSPVEAEHPGAVLFHQGEHLQWLLSDELMHLRSLRTSNYNDVQAFMSSPNLASFLGLPRVDALHMPVPLSIVFAGFQGDGNMHVNITAQELQGWFGHLDHILPHVRIQLSELTCAEDGHCSGLVHGTAASHKPVPSFVHLNFTCNVVVVTRKAVVDAFERAIHVFSRPVDPAIETGAQQVDASKMEAFVDSFTSYLGLEKQYTLLVLNPTWSVVEPTYGYRQGMSEQELMLLRGAANKVFDILGEHFGVEPTMPPSIYAGSNSWRAGQEDGQKFGIRDSTWNSEHWVNAASTYLKEEETYRRLLLERVGKQPGAAAVAQAVRLLRRLDTPIAAVLKEELTTSPEEEIKNVYSRFRTAHPAEDCLVSNWVGKHRWALIDLTAASTSHFDWGPALGGEGVVNKHSVPNVMDSFAVLAGLRTDRLNAKRTAEDMRVADELQRQKHNKLSNVANTAYHAYTMARSMRERHANAPGASPIDENEERDQWQRQYMENVLQAEMDIYEEYALRHCDTGPGGGAIPPSHPDASTAVVCTDIKNNVDRIRKSLAKLSSSRALMVDLVKDHQWDVFGAIEQQLEPEQDVPELASESGRAHDMFMADLSAVLSRAIRHVIAPPTATWTHAAGYLHDTATPFAKHVKFEMYVVSESSRRASREVLEEQFDLETFRQQVASLRLPSQFFSFHVTPVSLPDDPLLATAVSASMRTATHEIPDNDLLLSDSERQYIDSRELAAVLRQRFSLAVSAEEEEEGQGESAGLGTMAVGKGAGHGARAHAAALAAAARKRQKQQQEGVKRATKPGAAGHSMLTVPVFILQLERDEAVLIDQHYNARALEDMVVVVTNAAREDEHPTGMMCGGALVPRPLSPLKEALSAMLQHLGGVLPPHLGYNPGKHRVVHDWLWSVGGHPTSFTSMGIKYTDMQRDALARSYLLDAIDSSVDVVNKGVRLLVHARTSDPALVQAEKHQSSLKDLVTLFQQMVGTWREIVVAAQDLDWGRATSYLPYLEDTALTFLQQAQAVTHVTKPNKCTGLIKTSTDYLVQPVLNGSLIAALLALAYLSWPALQARAQRLSKKK